MITPCVAICQLTQATNICKGCGRTKEEIDNWETYTYYERMIVMKRLGYANERMGRAERMRRYDHG